MAGQRTVWVWVWMWTAGVLAGAVSPPAPAPADEQVVDPAFVDQALATIRDELDDGALTLPVRYPSADLGYRPAWFRRAGLDTAIPWQALQPEERYAVLDALYTHAENQWWTTLHTYRFDLSIEEQMRRYRHRTPAERRIGLLFAEAWSARNAGRITGARQVSDAAWHQAIEAAIEALETPPDRE